eukprot:519820-Pyramimonas_sp.AAC.2
MRAATATALTSSTCASSTKFEGGSNSAFWPFFVLHPLLHLFGLGAVLGGPFAEPSVLQDHSVFVDEHELAHLDLIIEKAVAARRLLLGA